MLVAAFSLSGLLPMLATAQTVDTVCYGGVPAAFLSAANASGSLGQLDYLYEWQDSTAGGNWAAAPGTNTDTAYQPVGLTETTFFRRQVRVLTCAEIAYSNVVEVFVLDSLDATFSAVSNASCSNTADGAATVSVSGGLSPYSYVWDDGSTTESVSGLAPGDHSVTVTDDFGCEKTVTVTIGFDNAAPVFAFDSDTAFIPSEFLSSIPVVAPSGFAGYEWSTGSTDSSTLITEAGYVFVTVTNAEGCQASDSIYVELTVGIADAQKQASVSVFPNPTREEVNIMIGASDVPDRVELRTLEGRVINVERNQSRIDVSMLPGGIYLLNIEHREQRWIKQLVVQ